MSKNTERERKIKKGEGNIVFPGKKGLEVQFDIYHEENIVN